MATYRCNPMNLFNYTIFMPLLAACLPSAGLAAGVAAQIPVPSGQPVSFQEVIWEQDGEKNIYRFRYIAPDISRDGGRISFDQAEPDLLHLCEKSALPSLREQNRDVDRIVISLSDIPVVFGKSNPKATQYIDAFIAQGIRCIWDGY